MTDWRKRQTAGGRLWAIRSIKITAALGIAVSSSVAVRAEEDSKSYMLQKSVAYNVAAHASASEIDTACKAAYPDGHLAELQESFSTENDSYPVDAYLADEAFRARMIETALAASNQVSAGKKWQGYIAGISAGISLARDDNDFAELVGLFYTKTINEFYTYPEREHMCSAASKTALETEIAMRKLFESGDYSLVYAIFSRREKTGKSP